MKQKCVLKAIFHPSLLLLIATFAANIVAKAQNLYEIDIAHLQNDLLPVKLTLAHAPEKEKAIFAFPATVPGTYSTQDYGRFVVKLEAFDRNGVSLPVKKEGNNQFVITNATKLSQLRYTVEDILDQKVKKNPVFAPASTNFDDGKNFIFNNGGIFGFIQGSENEPIRVQCTKPENFYGATSLHHVSSTNRQQIFEADSYHQLMDCPILFSMPDTAQFYVGNTLVTIAVYDVQGVARAKHFHEILKRDMQAVDAFLPNLPVQNYTFLLYVDYMPGIGEALNGNMNLFQKISIALKFKNLALGALEHGNSSLYYLADLGPDLKLEELSVDKQLTDAAIHEFMHILTPLGLHAQHIGNFDYLQPKMSKHLWLYEGVTEYFAYLIKLNAGIMDRDEYLHEMQTKLEKGLKFPIEQMSFTEMSAHVLEKKYNKQYMRVYDRGAVLAMMLDAEIQRLTHSRKSLLDVLLTLYNRYGARKSFDEDTFIPELVAEVHPDLQLFFDRYIEGRNQWQPDEYLKYIGIAYHDTLVENSFLNPLDSKDNDIKVKKLGIGLEQKVSKTGPREWAGLKKGDIVNAYDYRNAFKPDKKNIKAGETAKLRVKRNNRYVTLNIEARYGPKQMIHALRWRQ